MHPNSDFCASRASEATAEADAAKLDNVRDRALRSAAAWQAMADRAVKVERERRLREQASASAEGQERAITWT